MARNDPRPRIEDTPPEVVLLDLSEGRLSKYDGILGGMAVRAALDSLRSRLSEVEEERDTLATQLAALADAARTLVAAAQEGGE